MGPKQYFGKEISESNNKKKNTITQNDGCYGFFAATKSLAANPIK